MLHEFFIRDWLRSHFIIYAISHMLIMPMMTATIFSFTMQRPFWEAPWLFWAYAAADFFAFANWEISRKIRLPEDELEGVSSYSKEFGMFTAGYVVLGLRVLNTILAWIVGIYLNLGTFYYDAGNRESERFGLLNLRVGVGGEHWRVECWVRNALDTEYVPVAFQPNPGDPSAFVGESGAPRTFGLTFNLDI